MHRAPGVSQAGVAEARSTPLSASQLQSAAEPSKSASPLLHTTMLTTQQRTAATQINTHGYVMTPKQGCPVTPACTRHSAAPTLASGAQPMVRPYASGGWKRCTCACMQHVHACVHGLGVCWRTQACMRVRCSSRCSFRLRRQACERWLRGLQWLSCTVLHACMTARSTGSTWHMHACVHACCWHCRRTAAAAPLPHLVSAAVHGHAAADGAVPVVQQPHQRLQLCQRWLRQAAAVAA